MSTGTSQRNGITGICLGRLLVAITTELAILPLVAISSTLTMLV